ncbi:MAG TPA: hypothetical protein VKB79_01210 [Bryobacteraceae bacterium]|nr:hypothetical protein [Bryobacteraceae bacterium]
MELIILMAGLCATFFGYRLFCSRSTRLAVTLAGGLIAMLGVTVSVVEARTLARHQVRRTSSSVQRSPEWRNGSFRFTHPRSQRFDII